MHNTMVLTPVKKEVSMRQSKWLEMIITWVLIVCAAIICIELINLGVKYHHYKTEAPTTQKPPTKIHSPSPSPVWGVDTASKIDQSMYQCISENYGVPVFVARYLGNNGDVSVGLTKEEVKLLHDKKVKILPIHNHFTEATGMKKGQNEAEEAVKLAKSIGVKTGVIIVADIEPGFKVNAEFILGWTKTLLDHNYTPGVYGDFGNNELLNAYVKATKEDKAVKDNTILWSNQPSIGVTGRKGAPNEFKGKSPNEEKTFVWQYGIESKKCNIDTDLGKKNLLDLLW
jgi:hypothetical protein